MICTYSVALYILYTHEHELQVWLEDGAANMSVSSHRSPVDGGCHSHTN